MKKSFCLIVLVGFFICACDNPRDRRKAFRNGNDDLNNSPVGIIPPSTNNSGNTNSEGGSSDENTSSSSTQIPSDASHCQWSADGDSGFAQTHAHLGEYTVCQSKSKTSDVFFQIKVPASDAQICFIPTHGTGGSSVYIGEPRCIMATDNKRIYQVSMLVNRPNFTNFTVNGVMIMRDKAYFYPAPFYQYVLSPDAYLFCSNFLAQYGEDSYCQAFKSVGQYVGIKF